ncbi:MAG: complex I NDUFA9 subunit family protein [Alphaproteobacteria bacterium]|nr:complex I NDUFA9 subunit family protein [Alphaproteobacteria bacterium]MDX5416215.1 complex I NDUFA9 subunit family protein [Alphaproteobacteria bacterium]MDX5493546.1 complex I NDUFA9 subunit family protein [Alphaproteobacteria bacterium]
MGVDSANRDGATTKLPAGSLVTVFGGSGFLGRHIVHALARRGYRVRVAVRRPNDAQFLRPMGVVGQVEPVQANIRNEASVRSAIEGADAVVNLVGILYETGRQTFEAVQAEGAGRIARAAKSAGIDRFVHVSAIGADADSAAAYARSKAAGEAAVRAAIPGAAIVRPSIVFGPEDDFFNRFAAMARLSPALPLVGGGKTRFQPVYVKDVAEGVARILERGLGGATWEFGGPEVKSFRALLEDVLRVTGRKRILAPLPVPLAKLMSMVTQFIPNPPLTPDQVRLLGSDNVVSDAAKAEGRTLEGLGIAPTILEVVLPTYLYRFRKAGQFERVKTS